ncbi:Gfo/Idh/MocA family oxidoreductase [Halobacillus yeomjeoni]|uniref:Gfo/Idh/MocA family protein n=1 Tax=Halobacillus yeomjeoni TaxID=311194 RepID=UPI001CD66877|nr:Gfo/Idh/MocA family oxidoreductase [Halobacillus yeomjeoni]MCA0984287.1 Gfo/Idh/MocA family oxidoreductase [Halobacillus yeomjeoni]
MKWGIMGAANIARKALIPALQRAEGAEVTAVASLSGKEKELADTFDIPYTYESYEELLNDPEIEAVYIPLPNHLHKEWTIKAAQAGKHVLCEKPAALNRADMEEMLQACEENNVYFLEAFMYQFHPQHKKVKQLMEEGAVGEVSMIQASFSFLFDRSNYNIRLDPEKGGGALWDIGCYGVHSALNVMNEEVKDVQVTGNIDPEHGVDTTAAASLLLANGVVVQVDCSFDATFRNEYQVIGTEGIIKVHDAYRPDKRDSKGLITVFDSEGEQVAIEEGDQYRLQVETFMDAIRNNGSLEFYHQASLRYLDVMEQLQNGLK